MIDPITVSVLTHRLEAIVQEMGEAMLRTAYSQILNSSRDFSTAICDNQARLVAQAEHVPIHVGALPWAARAVHDAFRRQVRPGDVYLLNDPYHGNNHLPDLTAFVPVFAGDTLAAALLATVSWMAALTKLELSHAYPFVGLSFVAVTLASAWLLHEPLTSLKLAGVALVCLGVAIGSQG